MSISMTPAAREHVARSIAKRGKGLGVRLGVRSSGCSGMAYSVDFADALGPGDQVFEDGGVMIIVDADSLGVLDGTVVDYGREGLNEGFRFNNPNARSTCGCGESFGV
jgi:iron-sulfur cluster assembly protein